MNKDELKIINKDELKMMINKLENGIDKFIVASLFYGLNSNDYKEQLLKLTTDMVDLENSTITLPSGRVVYMDCILREATIEAINQKIYVKMGQMGSRTNEDYYINSSSKFIIKSKPSKNNNYGLDALKTAGFKARIRRISNYLTGDSSAITATNLKMAGVYNYLKNLKIDKKLTIMEAESLLKENGLSIRRNNLIPMLKEINEGI